MLYVIASQSHMIAKYLCRSHFKTPSDTRQMGFFFKIVPKLYQPYSRQTRVQAISAGT